MEVVNADTNIDTTGREEEVIIKLVHIMKLNNHILFRNWILVYLMR